MSQERVWDRVATRTRSLFRDGLRALGSPLAPEFYESLEELLIAGDLGPALAARLTAAVRAKRPLDSGEAQAALEAEVVGILSDAPRALNLDANPAVVLVYGINGAGKTTTIGKLGHGMKSAGRRPLIVAADTFRAAGIEQMVAWAERAGVEVFAGKAGGDSAAVAFDGIQAARARGLRVDVAAAEYTVRGLVQALAQSWA